MEIYRGIMDYKADTTASVMPLDDVPVPQDIMIVYETESLLPSGYSS